MQDEEDSAAAQAFFQLTTEVALLRRAIEGLAATTDRSEIPDYSPTLGKMAAQLEVLGRQGAHVSNVPPQVAPPTRIASEIEAVTSRAWQAAKGDWAQAQRELDDVVRSLAKVVVSAREARRQRLWVIGAAIAGLLGGVGLWTTLSGPVARALPARWQVAERLAAATLNEDRWVAGARLMQGANPDAWTSIVRGANLEHRNRVKIETCEKAAARRAKAQRCQIMVPPSPARDSGGSGRADKTDEPKPES